MSAFVCSPEHFILLAVAGAERRPKWSNAPNVDPRYLKNLGTLAIARAMKLPSWDSILPHELATLYATVLYAENLRSVKHRYPDCDDDLPGPIDRPDSLQVTPHQMRLYRPHVGPFTAAMLLKQCDCLEYQSCETDDWNKSGAYELLNKIRDGIISGMPGYDDAPWGFDGLPVKVRA